MNDPFPVWDEYANQAWEQWQHPMNAQIYTHPTRSAPVVATPPPSLLTASLFAVCFLRGLIFLYQYFLYD